MDTLIFSSTPHVEFASNEFYNVPVILQYEDLPLIQVVRAMPAGFTTEIPIYHNDGTYLAKVVGSQLYSTADGKKAGVVLEHPPKMTVCKLGSRILFELKRQEAARLKGVAELFTNDGHFIKCTDSPDAALYDASGNALRVGPMTMSRCRIEGARIGVLVNRSGAVSIAVGRSNPPAAPTASGSPTSARMGPKTGANEPCPCGSGKKYKRCCGR